MTAYGYKIRCTRGIQAGREFYVGMARFRLLERIVTIDDGYLPAADRSQRPVNKARAKKIATYLRENPKTYILPAITATIDGEMSFVDNEADNYLGELHIRMDAKLMLTDGQHRVTGIIEALCADDEIAKELRNHTIPVVIFRDVSRERNQQNFADINSNAKAPTASLTKLYDHRDDSAGLARQVAEKVPAFKDRIEFDKTSVSGKSGMLFSFSQLSKATTTFAKLEAEEADIIDFMVRFWTACAENLIGWTDEEDFMPDNRRDFICVHAVFLYALAEIGNFMFRHHREDFEERLKGLATIGYDRDDKKWKHICVTEERKMINNSTAIFRLRQRLEDPIFHSQQNAA